MKRGVMMLRCWWAHRSLVRILEQTLVITLSLFCTVRSDFTHFQTYMKKTIKFASFEGRSLFQPKRRENTCDLLKSPVSLPLSFHCGHTPWGVNTMSVSISTHSTGRELYRKWQISDVLSKCSFKRLYWPSQMASIYALISEMEINSISCLEYHARYWGCRGNGSKTDKILSGLAQSSQERSSTNNKRTCGSYGLPW